MDTKDKVLKATEIWRAGCQKKPQEKEEEVKKEKDEEAIGYDEIDLFKPE